jgi:hypothetical protein
LKQRFFISIAAGVCSLFRPGLVSGKTLDPAGAFHFSKIPFYYTLVACLNYLPGSN